jgi:HEPN domain-containing protein
VKKAQFDVDKAVAYWFEGAKYDIGTAEDILGTGRYPYALFMAHMALEKALKALYVKRTHRHAPRTHSLSMLARYIKNEMPRSMAEQLAGYASFHIQTRYPDYLFEYYAHCTEEFTRKTVEEMKGVFEWLSQKLRN